MKTLSVWLVCAVVSFGPVTTVAAQERGGEGAPKAGVDIVQVLGCLSEGPYNTWILSRATEPVVSNDKSLTPEAIKESEARPVGTKEYRLVVVSEHDPWAHKGHKVLVRGILTLNPAESRISVTALRRVSFSCPTSATR